MKCLKSGKIIIWVNGCVYTLLLLDSRSLGKKVFPIIDPAVQLHKTIPKYKFSPLCDERVKKHRFFGNKISTGSS